MLLVNLSFRVFIRSAVSGKESHSEPKKYPNQACPALGTHGRTLLSFLTPSCSRGPIDNKWGAPCDAVPEIA